MIETPPTKRRLKEAEPTMVRGPRAPGLFESSLIIVDMKQSMISGAEVPKASRVIFAMELVHTAFGTVISSPLIFLTSYSSVSDVISMIASINISVTTATPIKV